MKLTINPSFSGNSYAGTITNSEDPDEKQHNAAFHQRCNSCKGAFISGEKQGANEYSIQLKHVFFIMSILSLYHYYSKKCTATVLTS